jgi:hemolysin III
VLALFGLAILLGVAWNKPWHLMTFAVYGATLFLVYLASSLYHRPPRQPALGRAPARLRPRGHFFA